MLLSERVRLTKVRAATSLCALQSIASASLNLSPKSRLTFHFEDV